MVTTVLCSLIVHSLSFKVSCNSTHVFTVIFNPLTPRVNLWVVESFLTFDSMHRTLKCEHLLERG